MRVGGARVQSLIGGTFKSLDIQTYVQTERTSTLYRWRIDSLYNKKNPIFPEGGGRGTPTTGLVVDPTYSWYFTFCGARIEHTLMNNIIWYFIEK